MHALLFRPFFGIPMSAFLTLDSLSVRTADQRVLFDDLTLSLGAERVGLVRRNGSGKSTLLRIIAGGEPPASGTVSRQCSIGLLMQNFPPDQTIADALGVGEPIAVLPQARCTVFATAVWLAWIS